MITFDQIKADFDLMDYATYFGNIYFPGHGKFCGVYLKAFNKEVRQEQIDTLYDFKLNYRKYIPAIEKCIHENLEGSEQKRMGEILGNPILIDVIEIPYNDPGYDLLLMCGKAYTKFMFKKGSIDIRVELLDGEIRSIRRERI